MSSDNQIREIPGTLRSRWERKRPLSLEAVPLGFIVAESRNARDHILEILWDQGPLAFRDISMQLHSIPQVTVSRRLYEMSKYGDVVKVSKGFYSLPHQVESALSILTARVIAVNQSISISCKKPKIKQKKSEEKTGKSRIKKIKKYPSKKKVTKPCLDPGLNYGLLKSTLDVLIQEDLERCGGACQAVVKRLVKKVAKRTGFRLDRNLTRHIVHILNGDSRATLWDIGHKRGRDGKNLSERVYSLKSEGILSPTVSKRIQRESLRDRVIDLLTKKAVLTPNIGADLLQIKSSTLQNTLSIMVASKELIRVETGFYCLPGNEQRAQARIDFIRNPVRIEQIRKILSEESPLTPGSISKRLRTSYSLVFNALNRFVEEKQIVRMKRGFYCLPDQVEENQRISIETDPIIVALKEDYPQTPMQISERIGKPRSSVGGALRGMARKGIIVNIRYGLYCLPDQVEETKVKLQKTLEEQADRRKSQTITLTDVVKEVLTLLLAAKEISLVEIASATRVPTKILGNSMQRLIDHKIVCKNESGFVSIAPQDTPEKVRTIQMIAESDSWTEVIQSLVSMYMEKHLTSTGRDTQRLFRIRRFVISQLYFLHSTESQNPFNEAIDTLCLEGKLEKLENGIYRYHRFS